MMADLVACTHLLASNLCDTKALSFIVKDRSTGEHFQICLLLILTDGRFKFFSLIFQEDYRFLNKQPGTVDTQA